MRALLVTVAILALALPAGASAQQSQPHEKAMQKHVHQTKGVKTGFERSGAILARPDDTSADPQDTHKWSGPEAAGSPHCTPHFCVHWTGTGSDGSDAAHADQMKDLLENEVFPCENTTAPTACAGSPGLGWRLPASDGTLGGDARTDVYIENLYDSEKVFGYVATDPGQPQDPSVPHYAYMVLDKDYTRYAGGDAAGGLVAEQVTAAHEYNHVLQNAYDYLEDSWMFEATAVYMEDKVYPQDNDYLHYVPAWATNPHQPLTAFSNQNLKPYGSAVWNHWLDHRFGSGVVRSAWESSVGSADFAPAAYSAAIGAAGGAGFSDEFDRFSAAVAEWNAPGSGFPDPYPDVVRDGTLPAGSQTSPFGLAHTTFALFEVPVPSDSPPVIRLTATLPAGTSGAIALVGRTGADPAAGTVTSNLTPMPAGGFGAVQLDNPAAFGRITAVVVNSDISKAGFDFTADDYIFTKDAQDVVAAVIEPGLPIPVTGPAKSIADHAASITGSVDPHLIDTTWTIEYGRTSSYGSSTAPQPVAGSTLGAAAAIGQLTDLKASATYHYRVVASNSAGAAAGQDLTFKTARDVTAPTVALKVKRQKLRTARTRGALYLLRCSERCLGSTEVRLSRSVSRKLGLPTVIGKSRVVLEARVASTALRVRLSPRARKKLAGKHGRLAATIRVTVGDASHNRRTVSARALFLP